jgi:tryptophan-rich sensory protein
MLFSCNNSDKPELLSSPSLFLFFVFSAWRKLFLCRDISAWARREYRSHETVGTQSLMGTFSICLFVQIKKLHFEEKEVYEYHV